MTHNGSFNDTLICCNSATKKLALGITQYNIYIPKYFCFNRLITDLLTLIKVVITKVSYIKKLKRYWYTYIDYNCRYMNVTTMRVNIHIDT